MEKQSTRNKKTNKTAKKQGLSSNFIEKFAAELQAVQSPKREDR